MTKVNHSALAADAEIGATYSYVDASGQVVFEVLCFVFPLIGGGYLTDAHGKRKEMFCCRRKADQSWLLSLDAGEFMRSAPGKNWFPFDAAKFEQYPATRQRKFFDAAPAIPYQLPDLRKAIAAGRTIWIAQDEDEADFIRNSGRCATCCAGGAKNWSPEHSAFLQGADVVLYNGAKIVAQSLASIARRLRISENDTIVDWNAKAAADRSGSVIPFPTAQKRGDTQTSFTTPDSRQVREFFSTLAAQAKAATKHIVEEGRHPGLLQMILVHPTDEKISGIYRYELDDPELVERRHARP